MTSIHSSDLNTSIWGPLLNFLSQPIDGDSTIDIDTDTMDATKRIALLLDPEACKKPIPIHQFFSDLNHLDATKLLEKEVMLTMIKTIVNKIMSGLVSKSMLTALIGLIGHLVHLDSDALDDLIPDIKDAMKKAIKVIIKRLSKNPKMASQANQLLALIGNVLSQLGLPKQTPEQLIQGVAIELNIDADALKNLFSHSVTDSNYTRPQDPLATFNISIDALWDGADKLIDLPIPNSHAIATVGIQKLENELGAMLDMIQ